MASRRLETEIDRLYQLPLDEFTAARNALARDAGAEAAEIRQLAKAADRRLGDQSAVLETPRGLRCADRGGKHPAEDSHDDTGRAAGRSARAHRDAHEDALDAALKGTLAILENGGHPATDSTRQSVLTTLRALPSNETPGRLTDVLQPGGFEMLQGLSIVGSSGVLKPKPAPVNIETARGPSRKPSQSKPEISPEEAARAEARRAETTKALRETRNSRHDARSSKPRAPHARPRRAIRQLERARLALQAAEQALEEAEEAVAEAKRRRDAAAQRAKETERTLETARRQHEAARRG